MTTYKMLEVLLFLLRFVLIISIGLGARVLLRNARISVRMAAWYTVGIALLLLPLFAVFSFGIPILVPNIDTSDMGAPHQQGAAILQKGSQIDASAIIWLVYLSGILFFLAREVQRHTCIYRTVKHAVPPRSGKAAAIVAEARRALGLKRDVAVYVVEGLPVPLCCGFFRPVVLLPATAESWSSAMSAAVIRHEMAHVSRNDNFFGLIAFAIATFNWFNPLAWLAFRWYCIDREEACDAKVITSGLDAIDYAEGIVAFNAANSRSIIPTGSAALSGAVSFKQRIATVLRYANRIGRPSPFVVAILIMLGVCTMGIASIQPRQAPINEQRFHRDYSDMDSQGESLIRGALNGLYDGLDAIFSGEVFSSAVEGLNEAVKRDDEKIVIRNVIVR